MEKHLLLNNPMCLPQSCFLKYVLTKLLQVLKGKFICIRKFTSVKRLTLSKYLWYLDVSDPVSVPLPSFLLLTSFFVLGRAGAMVEVQLLFALGTAAPPGSHPPAAPRAGGATGDTARGCWGPIRTRCTSPPRAPSHRVVFWGRFNGFFSTCGMCGRAQ